MSNLAGDLTGGVLVTLGNVLLQTDSVAPTGQAVADVGSGLENDGAAGLPTVGQPLGQAIAGIDEATAPAGKVVILDRTVAGSSDPNSGQLIGVGLASGGPVSGDLATVGALNNGQTVSVGIADPTGAASGIGDAVGDVVSGVLAPLGGATGPLTGQANGLLNVNVDSQDVIGNGSAVPVGLNLLSPNAASGQELSVSVLSGGQLLGIQGPALPGGAQPGELLAPVNDLAGGLAGGGATPLAPVTDLLGGLGGGGSPLAPVTGLVDGLTGGLGGGGGDPLAPVTGLVDGLTGGLGGGSSPLAPVTGLVDGLTGGLSGGDAPLAPVTGLVGGLLGGR